VILSKRVRDSGVIRDDLQGSHAHAHEDKPQCDLAADVGGGSGKRACPTRTTYAYSGLNHLER
jgi:hypothetical protein